MEIFSVRTQKHTQFLDITREIGEWVSRIGLKRGTLTVFIPHTTAGITINENADPSVTADMEAALDRAVPWQADYTHAEGNSAAHVKAGMMGSSVQVIVEDGRLMIGTWQAVYLCEFDGPRQRSVWISAPPSA